MSNSANKAMNRKTLLIVIGGLLGVALIAWIVLMVGIFRGDRKSDNGKKEKKQTGKEQAANVTVYRAATLIHPSENGNGLTLMRTASYDEYGRIVRYSDYGTPMVVQKYQYDEAGNLSDVWILSSEDLMSLSIPLIKDVEWTRHIKFSYNSEGTMVLREDFAMEGELVHAYHYNIYGELTEEYEFDLETHEKKVLVESESNEDGHLVKRTNDDGYPVTEEFIYDESGRLTEIRKLSGTVITSKVVYTSEYVRENYGLNPLTDSLQYVLYSTEELYPDGRIKTKTYSRDPIWFPAELLDDDGIISLEPRPDLAEKEIHMKHDGGAEVVDYYIEREFSKAGHVLSEYYYNADGSAKWYYMEDGTTQYTGYSWELDEYGNPVRAILHTDKGDKIFYEIDYNAFEDVPAEYRYDDEETYLGFRYIILD